MLWQCRSAGSARCAVHEYVQQYFNPIERYRAVEFKRDWNRPTTAIINADQHVGFLQAGIQKGNNLKVLYGINVFEEGSFYNGLKHQLSTLFSKKRTSFQYNGSYLTTQSSPLRTSLQA